MARLPPCCPGALAALALHCGLLWPGCRQGVAAAAAHSRAPPALAADDECTAEGAVECGLSALQHRGQKVVAPKPASGGPPKAAGPQNSSTVVDGKPKTAAAFGTCGGERWKGPTVCPKGYYCFANSAYYSQCMPGKPKEYVKYNGSAELNSTSDAPLWTFYMYRASARDDYALQNANTGTLGGMLWYIHNEVVSCIYQDCDWARRYGIDRIRRFKVQTRATKPLHDAGMNFGIRYAFDLGQCTGPWDCNDQFAKFGYFVGCNNLSTGFPFPTWPVYYTGSWFSLPGACSELRFKEQSLECKKEQPGGLCRGTPTGTGSCTFSYEPAGYISLNELENITDYVAFKEAGGEEYSLQTDGGVNMSFWDGINDTEANAMRVQRAADLFKERYPHMASEEELPPPACDFDLAKFFVGGTPTKPNPNAPHLRQHS